MSKRVSDRCSGGQLEPGKTGACVRWLGDISFLVSRGHFPFDLCFQRITISCWNGLLPTIATAFVETFGDSIQQVLGDVHGPGEHPRAVDLRLREHSAGEGATRGDDYGMHGSVRVR